MGELGGAIGALLSGAAEGFLEAEQQDKLKRQTEKADREQRIFDIAGLLFKDPTSRPEVKQLALGALTADKDALKGLTDAIGTGLIRIPEPATTAPALPQGQAQEVPSIALNQEGKIDPNQPQVFQDDTPQQERPVELDLAPPETGPTPEALAREVIIEPSERELPLFRTGEELAREQGNLDLIRKTEVLNDAEKRAAVKAEQKTLRETKALNTAIRGVVGENAEAFDLVQSLILSGVPAAEAYQQAGVDKKPTRVQRRTFTRAALDSAFFGLATIEEAKLDIPDSNLFSATELTGLRDEALIRRKNALRIAEGSTLTKTEAGAKWNAALGAALKRRVLDPNEVRPTYISLTGSALQEQINVELLARQVEPSQVRDLVDRPFLTRDVPADVIPNIAEREAIAAGRMEKVRFNPVPDPEGVTTPVQRREGKSRNLAIELFKKDLE